MNSRGSIAASSLRLSREYANIVQVEKKERRNDPRPDALTHTPSRRANNAFEEKKFQTKYAKNEPERDHKTILTKNDVVCYLLFPRLSFALVVVVVVFVTHFIIP